MQRSASLATTTTVEMAPHIGGIILRICRRLELGQLHVAAVMLVAVKASRTLQCVCTHGVTMTVNSFEQRQVALVKAQFNSDAAATKQFACNRSKAWLDKCWSGRDMSWFNGH
jgi:hypothetical protein